MKLSEIEQSIRKPTAFEKSSHPFWNDPYISKNMLAAHLNPEWDAASRRIPTIQKTINWMKNSYFQGKKTILDLGCGPGLYTERYHDHGLIVTGIDCSERSIQYAIASAKQQKKQITYLCGDYLSVDFPGNYDLITMIYCDFGVFSDQERDRLLAKIFNALNDKGLFIFDVFTEGLITSKHESHDWAMADHGFYTDQPHLELSQTVHFPEEHVFGSQSTIITEDEIRIYRIWDRYYHAYGIQAFLKKARFEVVECNDQIITESNFASTDVVFVVARKRTTSE
jgi:SAM-dependent methyltransferase